tara:strand:+ start:357 stop:1361 length:1005 start_codon:yes stop_codon:yes gene_type:complete
MKIFERIRAFADLGIFFQGLSNIETEHKIFSQALQENSFFIKEYVCYAFKSLSNFLDEKKLEKWILSYDIKKHKCKRVLIVCAGNIPLVCFHDILCVLILGNKIILKPSSKDSVLIYFIVNKLLQIEPRFSNFISFSNISMNIDMVICTGNNISADYFKFYFKNKPLIIRSSRTSVSILSGNESKEELYNLSKDIFLYFGLGCRNVQKIYIPKSYDIQILKPYFQKFYSNLNCQNYYDNYIYNKAVFLLNKTRFQDFQNILMVESDKLYPPISVLFYQYYNKIEDINLNKDDIQCIVSNIYKKTNTILFGKSQNPQLTDYADNIDTISFLLSEP